MTLDPLGHMHYEVWNNLASVAALGGAWRGYSSIRNMLSPDTVVPPPPPMISKWFSYFSMLFNE